MSNPIRLDEPNFKSLPAPMLAAMVAADNRRRLAGTVLISLNADGSDGFRYSLATAESFAAKAAALECAGLKWRRAAAKAEAV